MDLTDELERVLGDALHDLPQEVRQLAATVMRRVTEGGYDALSDLGGLLHRRPDVHQGSGNGGIPTYGPHTWINVIPSPPGQPAKCAQTVLAIANKSGSRNRNAKASRAGGVRVGLAHLFRLLRENLILCGSGPNGMHARTALVITDHWDRRPAYESYLDIESHRQVGGLRCAVLHWDGMRWRRERM